MLTAFLLLLVAVSFTVTGEFLLKHGMNTVGVLHLNPPTLLPSLWRTFTNPFVLAGFAFVAVASIFWLSVLSRIPLSVAYPSLSLAYVIAVFAAWPLLGEHLTVTKVAGVLIIVLGVFTLYAMEPLLRYLSGNTG